MAVHTKSEQWNANVLAFLDRKFPNEPNYKASLVALWRKYLELGLPNAHFVSEFTNGKKESIFQRAWEMMIARHLDALGYHITNLEVGPDFRFERDGKTIWVEAISPEPKGLPEHWMTRPKADEFKVGDFPHNEILLRWTAAIKEKSAKAPGLPTKKDRCRKRCLRDCFEWMPTWRAPSKSRYYTLPICR